MGSYERTSGAAGGSGSAPTLNLKKKTRVVIYPGEVTPDPDDKLGTTSGHLFVQGLEGGDFSCEIAAGPWPGHGHAEAGGHTAGETKAGTYTLGPKHHHTTINWPYSSIPWGAALTERGGVVYYTIDGGPEVAVTGKSGVLYKANANYYDKSTAAERKQFGDREKFASDTSPLYTDEPKLERVLSALFKQPWKNGQLKPLWYQGDFGKWAWNLQPTAYYIHTTPNDEWWWMLKNKDVTLANSHGCIHVHPQDREKLEKILVAGMPVIVKKYGETPP